MHSLVAHLSVCCQFAVTLLLPMLTQLKDTFPKHLLLCLPVVIPLLPFAAHAPHNKTFLK